MNIEQRDIETLTEFVPILEKKLSKIRRKTELHREASENGTQQQKKRAAEWFKRESDLKHLIGRIKKINRLER